MSRIIQAISLLLLLLICLSLSTGQEVQETQVEENTSAVSEPVEPLTVKVSVNEVRLDVVVLDRRGNPVTDLTADDFEVFQDNSRQKITSVVYFDSQSEVAAQSVAVRKDVPNISTLPAQMPKKEDVRRTIIFVIDDYAMSFENGYYTKMALRNFVEKQMLSGDLVAILRTDYGNRDLNMFYSDKRELLARINALPTTKVITPVQIASYMGTMVSRGSNTPALAANIMNMQMDFKTRAFENQVSTLSYSFRALKRITGRKILNLMTTITTYYKGSEPIIQMLTDEALRTGIVVNILDVSGLKNYPGFADASSPKSELMDRVGFMLMQDELNSIPNALPAHTGGVRITDSNFFLNGIGREAESLLKGYYLISYVPPPDTFEKRDQKDDYRRLRVKVNRRGVEVHTRDGFFGKLESEMDAVFSNDPLIEAIYSPFQSTDLNVNIAAGYVKGDKNGYLVRSWIHLDPRDVKIVETENGNRIDLEAVYVASDINGNILDSSRVEFSLSNINMDWVSKHGIRFSMLLPVKKPDSYYIRISVQDKESGKVGSAYQFLEIPDLQKKGLALSNIFMITSTEDLKWIHSGDNSEGVFFPSFQAEDIRSPALRTYHVGDNLLTLAMLYNADAKAISRSEIETQTILYKDGRELMRGEPVPVTPDKVEDPGSIPLLNRFTVSSNLAPGDYALQILVTDKKNRNKEEGAANQIISFVVAEK